MSFATHQIPRRLFGGLAALLLALLAPSPSAHAVYNDNIQGRVTMVRVYTEGDYIYVTLENQPTSHPACNPAYFVIPETVPQNRRNQMFAALQRAVGTGEPINLGYDNVGECIHGYIRVHAVG